MGTSSAGGCPVVHSVSCFPTGGSQRPCGHPEGTDAALAPCCSGTADAFLISAALRPQTAVLRLQFGDANPGNRSCSRGPSRAEANTGMCKDSQIFLAADNIPMSIPCRK